MQSKRSKMVISNNPPNTAIKYVVCAPSKSQWGLLIVINDAMVIHTYELKKIAGFMQIRLKNPFLQLNIFATVGTISNFSLLN